MSTTIPTYRDPTRNVVADGRVQFFKGLNINLTDTYAFASLADQNQFFNDHKETNLVWTHTGTTASPELAIKTVMRFDLRLPINADTLLEYDYFRFIKHLDNALETSNTLEWTYAFITDIEFVNENSCVVHGMIDSIQTFMFRAKLGSQSVDRMHWHTDSEHALSSKTDEGQVSIDEVISQSAFGTSSSVLENDHYGILVQCKSFFRDASEGTGALVPTLVTTANADDTYRKTPYTNALGDTSATPIVTDDNFYIMIKAMNGNRHDAYQFQTGNGTTFPVIKCSDPRRILAGLIRAYANITITGQEQQPGCTIEGAWFVPESAFTKISDGNNTPIGSTRIMAYLNRNSDGTGDPVAAFCSNQSVYLVSPECRKTLVDSASWVSTGSLNGITPNNPKTYQLQSQTIQGVSGELLTIALQDLPNNPFNVNQPMQYYVRSYCKGEPQFRLTNVARLDGTQDDMMMLTNNVPINLGTGAEVYDYDSYQRSKLNAIYQYNSTREELLNKSFGLAGEVMSYTSPGTWMQKFVQPLASIQGGKSNTSDAWAQLAKTTTIVSDDLSYTKAAARTLTSDEARLPFVGASQIVHQDLGSHQASDDLCAIENSNTPGQTHTSTHYYYLTKKTPVAQDIKAYDDYLSKYGYNWGGQIVNFDTEASGAFANSLVWHDVGRSRFSYVKTQQCKVQSITNGNTVRDAGLYKADINQRFDNGVRFWSAAYTDHTMTDSVLAANKRSS